MLDLSYNPHLIDPLPDRLPHALQRLDVSHCALHGAVPESITNSSSINELFISHNFFSSFASSSMASWAALQIFDASSNLFKGSFPQALLNCTKLRFLNLDDNQVGGLVPLQLGGSTNLETLRLQGNHFTGQIPREIGNCMQLRQLWLDDNNLCGLIPESLGKLSVLTVLSLANNSFEGPFPQAITKCASLSFLSLSGNMLSGNIPAALASLQHLKILLLRNNQFSCVVPLDRRFLKQLQVFDVSNNKLEAWQIDKLLQFIDVATVLQKGYIPYLPRNLHVVGSPNSNRKSISKPLPCLEILGPDLSSSILRNPVHQNRHLLADDSTNTSNRSAMHMSPVTIGVLAGVGVFCSVLLVVGMVIICRMKVRPWRRSRSRRPPAKLSSLRKFRRESSRVFDPSLASISMRDLAKATDGFHFSRVVGDGGFGLVYSATLQDGRTVAVKKLTTNGMQGKREFEAEMETLGKIKHPNLVELLAHCKLGDERVLVYEFVENGSLDTWLHEKDDGPVLLSWARRVKIACGAARGLSYLHYDCNPHVIHRDIKSSNILLGKDFEPKIADFGLARTMSPLVSHVSTDAAGTLGYMAPEYSMTLSATKQADVYSFGMVMLELASGRRPNLLLQEKSFRKLAKWASHMLQHGHEMDVLDPVFKKTTPPSDQVRAYFKVACDCVSELPNDRPTMKEIHDRLFLIGVGQHD